MEEALSAILTDVAGGRRYWVRAPQSLAAFPYIVMNRIGGRRDYHLTGASGYVQSRVQLDVYSDTYGGTKTASREVRDAVSGYAGTVQGTEIQRITIESERDLPADDAGEITFLFRTSIDLMIHHKE